MTDQNKLVSTGDKITQSAVINPPQQLTITLSGVWYSGLDLEALTLHSWESFKMQSQGWDRVLSFSL